jgi:hypothetical protein
MVPPPSNNDSFGKMLHIYIHTHLSLPISCLVSCRYFEWKWICEDEEAMGWFQGQSTLWTPLAISWGKKPPVFLSQTHLSSYLMITSSCVMLKSQLWIVKPIQIGYSWLHLSIYVHISSFKSHETQVLLLKSRYPLVNCHITMENHHAING